MSARKKAAAVGLGLLLAAGTVMIHEVLHGKSSRIINEKEPVLSSTRLYSGPDAWSISSGHSNHRRGLAVATINLDSPQSVLIQWSPSINPLQFRERVVVQLEEPTEDLIVTNAMLVAASQQEWLLLTELSSADLQSRWFATAVDTLSGAVLIRSTQELGSETLVSSCLALGEVNKVEEGIRFAFLTRAAPDEYTFSLAMASPSGVDILASRTIAVECSSPASLQSMSGEGDSLTFLVMPRPFDSRNPAFVLSSNGDRLFSLRLPWITERKVSCTAVRLSRDYDWDGLEDLLLCSEQYGAIVLSARDGVAIPPFIFPEFRASVLCSVTETDQLGEYILGARHPMLVGRASAMRNTILQLRMDRGDGRDSSGGDVLELGKVPAHFENRLAFVSRLNRHDGSILYELDGDLYKARLETQTR